jgi:hypothetical protein
MRSAPLAAIPYLPSEDELTTLGRRRAVFGLAGLGVLVVSAIVLHLAWMPLDVLWYTIIRKLS